MPSPSFLLEFWSNDDDGPIPCPCLSSPPLPPTYPPLPPPTPPPPPPPLPPLRAPPPPLPPRPPQPPNPPKKIGTLGLSWASMLLSAHNEKLSGLLYEVFNLLHSFNV